MNQIYKLFKISDFLKWLGEYIILLITILPFVYFTLSSQYIFSPQAELKLHLKEIAVNHDKYTQFVSQHNLFTSPLFYLFILSLAINGYFIFKKIQTRLFKYDIFICSPMKNAKNDYAKIRAFTMDKINKLEKMGYNNDKIYYAGKYIKSHEEFDSPSTSIDENLKALIASKNCIMLNPENTTSSSITLEAFAALILKKKSIYFVHKSVDLPFMLKEANQNIKFAKVKIFYYSNEKELDGKFTKGEIKPFFNS